MELLLSAERGDPMSDFMSIQTFANRTGLPASTLRYYEKEGLIKPNLRRDNGYRQYRVEQIPYAITIHSLRQAGIQLAEIKQYLESSDARKADWLRKWRKDVDHKIASLNVARQFLHGIEPEDEHIRLTKWDAPVRMIWFRHRVKRELNPYAKVIEERAASVGKHVHIRCRDAYVRQERIVGDEIICKVGFRLPDHEPIAGEWLNEAELEVLGPALFVAMDGLSNDAYACFSLMLLLQSFGFEPAGPHMERYELDDLMRYQWMIPVLHGNDGGNGTPN
jgi:DNA-binding transcriptional MerR regulator